MGFNDLVGFILYDGFVVKDRGIEGLILKNF
jgi:hypothetical protein